MVIVTLFGTARRGQRRARSGALQRVAEAGLKVRVPLESGLRTRFQAVTDYYHGLLVLLGHKTGPSTYCLERAYPEEI